MKLIQRIIYTGFAAVALASAAMPVFPAHDTAQRAALQGPDPAPYQDRQIARAPEPPRAATTVKRR